jgi:FKBP-type peptidyl-prolyl cis-trans isomerase SlyD
MQIADKSVVSFEYTLKDDDGKVLDTSDGRDPLTYLHGSGNIIPGLEKALAGKSAGDSLELTVGPEEGYGRRDEAMIRNIPVRKLSDKNPVAGRRYRAQLEEGVAIVVVQSIKGDYAVVDANHPLADKTLHFSIKITEVRAATEEELQHGHVHAPGGHHHH